MRVLEHLFFLSTTFAAPLLHVEQSATVVPGQYIVKLKHNEATFSANAVKALSQSLSTSPKYEYSLSGFHGFAGKLSNTELASLQASEHVRDVCISSLPTRSNTAVGRIHRA